MKILSIGLDRKLFEKDSEVQKRIKEYGSICDELHIIVLSLKSHNFQDLKLADNIFIYSTNSLCKLFYFFDAYRIGKNIIYNSIRQPANKIQNFVITVQDPFETGIIGYFLKRKFKIPLQIQIHTDFLSPYFWQESFLNKMRVILAKFLLLKADCIRVVSKKIKKSLLDVNYKEFNIYVLPVFIDTQKIKQSLAEFDLKKIYPQFDFLILMASRLSKEKNITLAIEAIGGIIKKYPKTGLIIAGDGKEERFLKLEIKNQKLDANIIFEKMVNFERLVSYYKTADIFLLTSNYEGCGRTIIEALASGCPVISTNVGCAEEFIENNKNGFIIPVGDLKYLQNKILEIIENKELKKKNLENIKKSVFNLPSKEEYLKQYKESLERCL